MPNVRSADEDDLTARATIRNAALRLFAEAGHEAVSVRQIAAEAGVSPALVLHHFGSKAGLREAVDAHAARRLDEAMGTGAGDSGAAGDSGDVGKTLAEGDAGSIAEIFFRAFPEGSPLPSYVRRLLLSGDPAGVALFGRWFESARQVLDRMTDEGLTRPSDDPDVRAAFALAGDVALLLLREPLTAALGFDPMTADGMTRWSREVAEITRHGMFAGPHDEARDDPEDDHTMDEE